MSEENQWIQELRSAIERGCDLGSIRNIGKCRPLTDDLRLSVWKICLNIHEIDHEYNYIESDAFDLREQSIIHDDITRLVHSLDINEDDRTSKINDLEAVITSYCKKYNETYEKCNGWIEILKPIVSLNYQNRSELYALFASIRNRYIPRDCEADGMPYQLFRLLLLYHDPELCSFFDTKKLTPDLYAHVWIRSLYAGLCQIDIILQCWDGYFQQADQFFAFFLALVLLMFAKDELLKMVDKEKNEIINFLSKAPSNLTLNDLEDFFSLANHYASNTPQSFRKEFSSCLFNESDGSFSRKAYSTYQALCLPVSVKELLQANQLGGTAGVRYFLVDCRPAEQYNAKHFYTAFHLDANLLLENPKEFAGTLDALFAAQQHAIDAGSNAGGEHLCFIGSGNEDEDKYVRMVVAYCLQRNTKYVSIASGGYKQLNVDIEDPSMLTQAEEHNVVQESVSTSSMLKQNLVDKLPVINTQTASLINMISSAVKTKSMEMKDKVKGYVAHAPFIESSHSVPTHVSKEDKITKLYRQDQTSVFSLNEDEDENDSSSTSQQQGALGLIDMESMFVRSDILHKYECDHFDENDEKHPSLLLVSSTRLYILRKLPEYKTMANLICNRPLNAIIKITSKKTCPEIITFHYTTKDKQEKSSNSKKKLPFNCDKVYLPDAGEATKDIKLLIVKSLNMFDDLNETTSS